MALTPEPAPAVAGAWPSPPWPCCQGPNTCPHTAACFVRRNRGIGGRPPLVHIPWPESTSFFDVQVHCGNGGMLEHLDFVAGPPTCSRCIAHQEWWLARHA